MKSSKKPQIQIIHNMEQGTYKEINRFVRIVLNSAGVLCVCVGILGIVVPVLPTTVFFIMASALFIRSNPRMHKRLNKNKLTGPYIKAYTEKKGLSLNRKIWTILILWISLGISMWLTMDTGWVPYLLIGIGIAVSIHVATIRAAIAKEIA